MKPLPKVQSEYLGRACFAMAVIAYDQGKDWLRERELASQELVTGEVSGITKAPAVLGLGHRETLIIRGADGNEYTAVLMRDRAKDIPKIVHFAPPEAANEEVLLEEETGARGMFLLFFLLPTAGVLFFTFVSIAITPVKIQLPPEDEELPEIPKRW